MAMTLIQRIDVTSSASANYTFSSIPQTYTDLLLVTCALGAGNNADANFVWLNGISSATYSYNMLRRTISLGNDGGFLGSTSYIIPTAYSAGQTNFANFAGNGWIYFPNYTNTNINRSINSFTGISSNTSTSNSQIVINGAGNTTTAAITSILFSGYALNLASGTTLSLYGIS
jgi:hypothetical protein